ncbi:MAG TPA: hypothetical protein VIG99_18050 [Myxococcaceae bacterium]|jgi:hypothetical protein
MGFNVNSPLSTIGSLLSGVGSLLQRAGGGQGAAPAAQPAQQAPVDQFQQQAPAAGAPQIAPGEPNPNAAAGAPQGVAPGEPNPTAAAGGAAPAGGAANLPAQLGQLVQALSSLVQMIAQLLGGKGGAAAGGAAGAGAAAGGATASAAAAAGGATASASAGAAAGAKGDAFSQLQAQFGEWHGKGKNSSAPTGPNAKKLVAEAEAKLSSGDTSGAAESYKKAQQTSSPVMLDLNHDGKLGTTGVSTAKDRADGQTGKTIAFDIDGDGKKENVEWMDGKGDGMLVDDKNGAVTAAANGNGEINGKSLFGDEGGKFGNGYNKMAQYDANKDGQLTGAELQGVKVWQDNGDGKVQAGELKSLAELGITQLSTGVNNVQNARGENLQQSSFVQNGQTVKSEDVWFANKGNVKV